MPDLVRLLRCRWAAPPGCDSAADKLKRRRDARSSMVGGCGSGVTGEPLAGVFDPPCTMDPDQAMRGSPLMVQCFPQARLSAWLGKATAPSVSRGRGGPAPPRRRPGRQPRRIRRRSKAAIPRSSEHRWRSQPVCFRCGAPGPGPLRPGGRHPAGLARNPGLISSTLLSGGSSRRRAVDAHSR